MRSLLVAVLFLSACTDQAVADRFETDLPAGMTSVQTAAGVARIARTYLLEQESQLAAPELHIEPDVVSVTLRPARQAPSVEPRVPSALAEAAGEDLVWVVAVAGDVFDHAVLPWSDGVQAHPCGSIVISDSDGAILGVFPHHDLPSSDCP